jgi:hypothetical protein
VRGMLVRAVLRSPLSAPPVPRLEGTLKFEGRCMWMEVTKCEPTTQNGTREEKQVVEGSATPRRRARVKGVPWRDGEAEAWRLGVNRSGSRM